MAARTINEIQNEILRIKRDRGVCILAHSYQAREIIEIADFTGDSYMLSVKAMSAVQPVMLMCGVRFMAETVKIQSPGKTVILANPGAGCPMAEQMDKPLIEGVRKMYPGYTVAAYINTTAELKTVCDVCVTSSSAVKILGRVENNDIIFIPDCNLGQYVADKLPQKNIKLLQGGCPIHAAVTAGEVRAARENHPDALLLVHPECLPEVVALADYVGSTSGIMDYAAASGAREFIIGTEGSIAEHLQYTCPDKSFYQLSQKLLCPNMRLTTLIDVYNAVKGEGGEEILLDEETIKQASHCINEMIRLGE